MLMLWGTRQVAGHPAGAGTASSSDSSRDERGSKGKDVMRPVLGPELSTETNGTMNGAPAARGLVALHSLRSRSATSAASTASTAAGAVTGGATVEMASLAGKQAAAASTTGADSDCEVWWRSGRRKVA